MGGCGTEQACALVLLLRTLGPRVFPVQPGATCYSPLSQIFINEGQSFHKYVLPLSGSLLCAGNIGEREFLSSDDTWSQLLKEYVQLFLSRNAMVKG